MVGKRNKDDDWDDSFFGDFFDDFGFDFKRMNEKMQRIFENLMKEGNQGSDEKGPFVYGFSYRVGPDGRPQFQEFGNVPSGRRGYTNQLESDTREPMTDFNEDKDKVYVTVELPGVSKENIDLKISERNITVDAKEEERKYHKSIDFPYRILTESATAKFKNGILDVVVSKESSASMSGKSVKIE
ncbi:Small heat shock protein HSP16.5 [Thermoplasmatales archaeon]|nr:Small heat shock protein HSP16.5 [Thermoplasmatales archaeon]